MTGWAVAHPKPSFKHSETTAKDFSKKTRKVITKRDGGLCVKCSRLSHDIHHVIFKSQGGKGTADNGVCVCYKCHEWAHAGREGREWFEQYRIERLVGEATSTKTQSY